VQHLTFIEATKATSKSQTYYKSSSYMDCAQSVKTIQSQCVQNVNKMT